MAIVFALLGSVGALIGTALLLIFPETAPFIPMATVRHEIVRLHARTQTRLENLATAMDCRNCQPVIFNMTILAYRFTINLHMIYTINTQANEFKGNKNTKALLTTRWY